MAARFTVTDPHAPARVADPALGRLAGEIMAAAAANSPVAERSAATDPGELRAGWRTRKTAEGYEIYNDVEYAIFVEFGSEHNPDPAGMLGQAIEQNRGRRL